MNARYYWSFVEIIHPVVDVMWLFNLVIHQCFRSFLGYLKGVLLLGPLLFYINDLPETIHFSTVSLFADDTILLKSITFQTPAFCRQCLDNWCRDWNLNLHPDKTVVLRLSLNSTHSEDSPSSINGNPLCFSNSHKDLGVLVSELGLVVV